MISAFGVVHKAMLPGGVFKPAKALSTAERGAVKGRIQDRQKYRADAKQEAKDWGISYNAPKNYNRGVSNRGRKLNGRNGPAWGTNKTEWKSLDDPERNSTTTAGMQSKIGGHAVPTSNRKTGVTTLYGKPGGSIDGTPISSIQTHEQRHLSVKRNPVRWRERRQDPVRQGREEGRADFGLPRNRPYPGSPEFRRGYEEVQGKMATAQARKQRLAERATRLQERQQRRANG